MGGASLLESGFIKTSTKKKCFLCTNLSVSRGQNANLWKLSNSGRSTEKTIQMSCEGESDASSLRLFIVVTFCFEHQTLHQNMSHLS